MGLFSAEPSDTAGTNGKPLSSGEAGAVAAATEQVKSKRGGFRPGSGRKPGIPNLAQPKPGTAQPNQVEASEADIEFVKTIAEAGLKILDRIETNSILGVIHSIGDKSISEKADAYLRQREIGPGDVEVVVNAAGAIAAKYAVLTRYAPEAALVSWAVIHGMAFTGVMSDLRKLAKTVAAIRAAKLKGSDVGSPPTS